MSGGLPRTGLADSKATIKYNGASNEPGIGDAELVKRRLAEIGKPTLEQAPDTADLAMRDAVSGQVRRARTGSSRNSILGQAMMYAALLGASLLAWLSSLRGE